MKNAPRHHHRGAAAVVAIILLVVMQLVIVAVVAGGARDHELTRTRLETVQAFYAAEAGIQLALREQINGVDYDSDGSIGSISNDGNDNNDPLIGAARVQVTASTAGSTTTLMSTAIVGTSQRQAETDITATSGGAGLGLRAEYFACSNDLNLLSDVDWDAPPTWSGIVTWLNMPNASGRGWPGGQTNRWGKRFTGKITVPEAGNWTFWSTSDAGSRLWINGALVVDNDGLHGSLTSSGSTNLAAGTHDFEVRWFEHTGEFELIVEWRGPGVPVRTVVPATAFTH